MLDSHFSYAKQAVRKVLKEVKAVTTPQDLCLALAKALPRGSTVMNIKMAECKHCHKSVSSPLLPLFPLPLPVLLPPLAVPLLFTHNTRHTPCCMFQPPSASARLLVGAT